MCMPVPPQVVTDDLKLHWLDKFRFSQRQGQQVIDQGLGHAFGIPNTLGRNRLLNRFESGIFAQWFQPEMCAQPGRNVVQIGFQPGDISFADGK